VRFGKHLKKFRTDRGYTQEQLAAIANLHRTFISDMERGAKEPSLMTLVSIAASFNMTISELLKGF
jgi:DNA-binding XRE family transcriptional regulator